MPIDSIPVLVEEAILRLIGDMDQATESSLDTKVISLIPTAVNRALARGFRSATFYAVVEEVVHECVPKPRMIDAVARKRVNSPFFTVPVAKLVKHEVQNNFFNKVKM